MISEFSLYFAWYIYANAKKQKFFIFKSLNHPPIGILYLLGSNKSEGFSPFTNNSLPDSLDLQKPYSS